MQNKCKAPRGQFELSWLIRHNSTPSIMFYLIIYIFECNAGTAALGSRGSLQDTLYIHYDGKERTRETKVLRVGMGEERMRGVGGGEGCLTL